MKRSILFLVSLVLIGFLAGTVLAQEAGEPVAPPAGHPGYGPALQSFDIFLSGHPNVRKRLKANPDLINDPHYLQEHPALREYLAKHPTVASDLKQHPEFFMTRETQFEQGLSAELAHFDKFLDAHPVVAKDLTSEPRGIHDKKFLKNHPALQEYLNHHPNIAKELDNHPGFFMAREHQLEKSESK